MGSLLNLIASTKQTRTTLTPRYYKIRPLPFLSEYGMLGRSRYHQ